MRNSIATLDPEHWTQSWRIWLLGSIWMSLDPVWIDVFCVGLVAYLTSGRWGKSPKSRTMRVRSIDALLIFEVYPFRLSFYPKYFPLYLVPIHGLSTRSLLTSRASTDYSYKRVFTHWLFIPWDAQYFSRSSVVNSSIFHFDSFPSCLELMLMHFRWRVVYWLFLNRAMLYYSLPSMYGLLQDYTRTI